MLKCSRVNPKGQSPVWRPTQSESGLSGKNMPGTELPSNRVLSLTSPLKLSLMVLLLISLVACSSPSATPPAPTQPPTVDLTGTWDVLFQLDGISLNRYTWRLVQQGSTVFFYDPNSLNVPCGVNELSTVSGNRWRARSSFNPSNCPIFAPLSGRLSLNVLANATAFGGAPLR